MRRTADLLNIAREYEERSIALVPLTLDEDRLPKKPAFEPYSYLRPEDNTSHDWEKAAGLGIVLGRPSGNLATIDVDDVGLCEYLLKKLSFRDVPPLMDRTVREQLHVYCVEPVPSEPVDLEVSYQGRRCLVQLLASGCVAAAPPTPGYTWINPRAQPFFGQIADIWRDLSLEYGLPYREARPWSFMRRQRSRGPTTAEIRKSQ